MAPEHAHRPDDHAFVSKVHHDELARAATERDDRVLAFQLYLEDTGDTKPCEKGKAPMPDVREEEAECRNKRKYAETLVIDEDEVIAQQMQLREMQLAEAPEQAPEAFSEKEQVTAPLGALVACVTCMEELSEDKLVSAKKGQRGGWRPCEHSVCDVCVKDLLGNEINYHQRSAPWCPCFTKCDFQKAVRRYSRRGQ